MATNKVQTRAESGPRVNADGSVTVYSGDCLKVLQDFKCESVDTVLTSPPYWGARDYESADQVGAENDAADYVASVAKVFGEVKRVLKRRGTAWLNIGDVYFRGPTYSENSKRRYTQGWVRNKQLGLLPFRVAIALQDAGWLVRNTVVWFKPNALPASVTDRLTNRWEPFFLLAKDDEYFFNLDAVRLPPKTSDANEAERLGRLSEAKGKAVGRKNLRKWLNSPRHRLHIDGAKDVERRPDAPPAWELAVYLKRHADKLGLSIHDVARELQLPYERTRHYLRPDKIGSRLPPPAVWERLKVLLRLDDTYDDAMRVEVGDNRIRNHPLGKNPGDVAAVSLEPFAGNHYATMPKTLAQALLQATLPPGGLCLDPFCGTGTTGLAALTLGGRFVGIDLVDEFCELAFNRLARFQPSDADRLNGRLAKVFDLG